MNLSPETLAEIEATIPRYPSKRSAVMPLLHAIQEEIGHLPPESVVWVAEKLGLEPIHVQEVVTFYPGYRREAPGRTVVRVCRTLPCALVGAYRTCDRLKEGLGCDSRGHSPDGAFTVEFVECLASCGTGPVALVGEELVERLDDAGTAALVERLRAAEANR